MQENIIETQALTKKFRDEAAVRGVTFNVPRGKIFGFIGPSGCGKTTTVRMLTGIYTPTAGRARVLGHSPPEFTPAVRAKLGYMPQHFVLYPNLNVWENINFVASLYGVQLGRKERLNQLLEFVELDKEKRKLARNLSGGMRRRLSLAATLVHNPELIFLDEPTAGIDPVLRHRFWSRFKELQEEGQTLFVTTQYVGEAAYCDYIGVMVKGRLMMVETPEGLRRRAFGGEMIDMRISQRLTYEHIQEITDLPFVRGKVSLLDDTGLRLVVDDAGKALPALLDWSKAQNLITESIEEYLPPFDEVFIKLVNEDVTN